MGSRRFEFVEGSSSKFWEVEVSGSEYTTRWGRIGTDGQSKTKSCKSDDAAQTEADKLIAEKTGKGYVEVGGTAKPATKATTKATTKAVAKPAAAKKAAATTKQAEPAKKTVAATTKTALVSGKAKGQAKAAAAPAATVVETATATDDWTEREFEFNDAKSSKFWRIALDGTSHTVTFGKIGTNGQSKTKDFSSEAAAKKDAEKLIAEKTSKGYVEKGGSAGNGAAPKAAPAKKAAPKAAGKGKGNEADDEDDESPAATPAATRAPSAATFSLSTERKLTLTPREWAVATWRKESQKPLPSEKPAPFDKAAAIKVVKKIKYRYEFPVRMLSPEEAHFWLHVGTKLVWSGFDKPEQLEKMTFDGKIDRKQAVALAARAAEVGSTTIAAVGLAGMIGTVDAIDEAMSFAPAGYARMQSEGFGEVLAQLVPFLDEKSREELRKRIRKNVTPQQWPTDYYNAPPLEIALAPSLGMHKELAAIVKSWPDNNYTGDAWHDHYHHPQLVVFGLGSAGEVEAEFRRLRLRLRKPEHVRAWLAHTEYSALDYVAESLRAESNRDEATKLVEAFASAVEAPEAAGPMLDLKLNSKAPKIAKDWLDTHVAHGVAGLVPIAAGRGKAADAAIQQLLEYKRAGHEKLIIEAQKATPNSDRVKTEVINRVEKTYTPFDDKSTPKWLADGAAALAKAKRKGKLGDPMPPVVVGDHRFNDAQTDLLIRGLQASTWDKPAAIVKGLREHGDADSLDTVAWHLFEQWLTEGAPSGEKWAMMAIGFLGGDRSALKLTPMVRAWPGESQHKRAVTGLECLRQIGSDVALMQLNGIAQKLKFKGLKTTAQSYMEEIAKARGLTRSELEDLIVPDCDLDERGTRIFDFGPRKFTFVLGSDLKPMIKDEAGKLKDNLPAPGAKDDKPKAEAAVAEWKLMKKTIKDAAAIQSIRLEAAMVTGRRWPLQNFEQLLVKHPLMTNLVQKLLWGGYDKAGKLVRTFRVTSEQDYADVKDAPADLKGLASVGIVHPLELDAQTKQSWGEMFGDYEIMPPFPQLGRPVFSLEKGEEKATTLDRFKGKKLAAVTLVGTLEKLGWDRGVPQDAGVFHEHARPFHAAGVTAVIQYPGVPVGYMVDWEDQEIESIFMLKGIYKADSWWDGHKDKRMKLGDVDPIVISEVINDMSALAAKAR